MSASHVNYLNLLDELGRLLEKLADLARRKADAVRGDDLMALDQVLKEEQVLSLSLRGTEQKRLKLLKELGLEGVPLSKLADHYPSELQFQAGQHTESLRRKYQIYQCAAQVARSTLESNLHQIDKIVADLGGSLPEEGVGYAPPEMEPPRKMKTDFRA